MFLTRGCYRYCAQEEIKAGGKRTAELHWEQDRLVLEEHDLIETTRDFQLMRVTKELQNIIKSGYANTAAGENAALESLEGALKTAHGNKLGQRKASLKKLRRQIDEKLGANDKLDASIMDASVAVAQREQVPHPLSHPLPPFARGSIGV